MNVVKKTCFALVAILMLAFAASPAMAQGVAFQPSSLPRQIRMEGNTETVGEVSLLATTSGLVPAGSVITLIYSSRITNSPGSANVTCLSSAATSCGGSIAVTSTANLLQITFNAGVTFTANTGKITVAAVRVNASTLIPGTLNVFATLSASSANPAANPITFTQNAVPVGFLQNPSITGVSIPPAAGDLSVTVTERFPAALTSVADETSVSATPPPTDGTQILVTMAGIPAGATVTPQAPTAGPLGANSFNIGGVTPLPAPVVSTGSSIFFAFTIDGGGAGAPFGRTLTGTAEDVVLHFNINPPPAEPAAVTAAVGLGPIDEAPPFRIVSFPNRGAAPAGTFVDIQLSQDVYVAGETVTATTFRLGNLGADPGKIELKVWAEGPGTPPAPVINQGAAGNIQLPAGFDHNFGPAPLFPVTALFNPGNYILGARIINPVTGELLSEDLNPFVVE